MSDEIIHRPQIKITWLIGVLAAFGLFALIGAYSARMTRDYADYDQERATKRYATLAQLRQDEGKLINPVDKEGKPTAEWVDQANGIVRIPIEEAMAKEVDTLKSQVPAAGSEIPGAAPAPAPSAPAAPAAPAPPAPVAKAPATPAPAPAKPKP